MLVSLSCFEGKEGVQIVAKVSRKVSLASSFFSFLLIFAIAILAFSLRGLRERLILYEMRSYYPDDMLSWGTTRFSYSFTHTHITKYTCSHCSTFQAVYKAGARATAADFIEFTTNTFRIDNTCSCSSVSIEIHTFPSSSRWWWFLAPKNLDSHSILGSRLAFRGAIHA